MKNVLVSFPPQFSNSSVPDSQCVYEQTIRAVGNQFGLSSKIAVQVHILEFFIMKAISVLLTIKIGYVFR